MFDDDLELPDARDPEVIGPASALLTQADLAAARADAWAEGRESARAGAEAAAAVLAEAAVALARETASLRDELRDEAEANASALARLLLDTLAALFPALCARNGEAEVRAVARALLPGLSAEPEIVVRANPAISAALEADIAGLTEDDPGRIRVLADPAMAPSDVRLRWRGGFGARDAAALWEEVAAALAPAGLLSAHVREIEHVG